MIDSSFGPNNIKSPSSKIYTESISCLFSKNSNSDIIKDTLLKLPDIISVKLTDTYDGPQIKDNKISYTFEIKSFNKNAFNNVKNLIIGFGAKIR